jgi:Tol biopolymer transport system component
MADRRRKRETLVADVPEPRSDGPLEPAPPESLAALGEELARLPEKYRTAIVLCELQGQSRRDVARRLGVPEGTLSSRLAAGRKKLADRLRKRGVVLSVGAVAGLLADLGSAGAVPPPLSAAATTFGTAAPAVPSAVSTLADGVIRAMVLNKLLVSTAALAVLVLVAGLGGHSIVRALPQVDEPTKPVAAARQGDRPAALKKAAEPGRLLVFRNEQLLTIDPDGAKEVAVIEKRAGLHPSSGWLSPDGKRVLYARPEFPELPPGERQGRADPKLFVQTIGEKDATDLGVSGITACWSADGSEVAVTNYLDKGEGHEHYVVNVKAKEKSALKLPADHLVMDWSRDGKFLLTMSARVSTKGGKEATFSTRLYLMNRDGTEHKALPEDPMNYAFARLSPDGTRVLCQSLAGKDQPRVPLSVVDVATGKATPVADFPLNGTVMGHCWSPDGKRIAYTWQLADDGKPGEPPARETESFLVVCDPDGKNAKTVLSEKRRDGRAVTLGTVDWR